MSENTRFQYLLEVQVWGISKESLYSYPLGKRRKLFVRSQASPDAEIQFESGPSLKGATNEVRNLLRRKQPYLGLAAQYGHKGLSRAASALIAGQQIEMVTFRDRQAHSMVKRVVREMVEAPDSQGELIDAILQAGDLGLSGVEILTREVPPHIIERIRSRNDGDPENIDEEAIRIVFDRLVFHHKLDENESFQLNISQQSTGTLTWLTICWHALTVLRKGGVLLIDEIDASLHPELVRFIIGLFQESHTNPHAAQLICTTHDVSLLGNSPKKILQPENVWFVEKAHNSTSELYSMREFDNRENNNNQRRYAAGALGPFPTLTTTCCTGSSPTARESKKMTRSSKAQRESDDPLQSSQMGSRLRSHTSSC